MSQTLEVKTPDAPATSFNPRAILAKLGPFIGLLFVFMLFAALKPHTFLTAGNMQIMLLQTAVVGTAALGMTVIIISGGIDLSVGSVVALSTVVIALLLNVGAPQWVAAVGGAMVGVAAGFVTGNLIIGQVGRVLAALLAVGVIVLIFHLLSPSAKQAADWDDMVNNGSLDQVAQAQREMAAASAKAAWVAWPLGIALFAAAIAFNELWLKKQEFAQKLGLIPFIATLGMMGALRGAAHGMGDNGTVVVQGKLWLKTLLAMTRQGDAWQLLPSGVWMMLVLAVVVALMLAYTKFGRHVFAIGSNENTARLCGINVDTTKLAIYMIGVGFAGLAGVLQFSYLGEGDTTTAVGMELNIIAAVVIGGASLNGGEGTITGSLIGALIMTVVANGCTKLALDSWVQEIVTGAIIIIAVMLDRVRHRRAAS